ncbi:MAG: LysE family translocator [Bacillota bacterium]
MEPYLFIKGLIIGFSIAAPVGPIGILCIRLTLSEGRARGLVCGLGAATADAIYGSIAGFGLTAASAFLVNYNSYLSAIGGLFLLYLGFKTIMAPPSQNQAPAGRGGLAGTYASTFFLTLVNPMTILSFAAVFAGLGIGSGVKEHLAAAQLISGVFTGSALWWFFLSGAVGLFRERITPPGLKWINIISGAVLLIFGVVSLSNVNWLKG